MTFQSGDLDESFLSEVIILWICVLYIFMKGVCSSLSQDFQVPPRDANVIFFVVASPVVHCNEEPENMKQYVSEELLVQLKEYSYKYNHFLLRKEKMKG